MQSSISLFGTMLLLIFVVLTVPRTAHAAESVPDNQITIVRTDNEAIQDKTIHAELGDPSIQLTVIVTSDDGGESRVRWTSSDTSVAIVSSDGKVIMFGSGETTITVIATDGSRRSDSVTVVVGASGSKYGAAPGLPEHNDGSRNSMNDFLGVNFINPQYHFESDDAIVEGAQRLQELNTKSIKMYLSPNYRSFYQFNDWRGANYTSPAQLVQSEPFKAVLDMDFNTYFFGAYVFTEPLYATYWYHGFSDRQKQIEYDQIYELAYHLLTTYEGTGKTFILQNWEGDWSTMLQPNPATDPSDAVLKRMIEWINIRQNAVNDARIAANASDVYVYHALEINLLKKAMEGGKTVANNVIPYTYCDYYSYSAYDMYNATSAELGEALDYLKSVVARNLAGGTSRIFIGEFGLPENEFGSRMVLSVARTVIETAREKEIDHVLFWQLYDDSVGPNLTDSDYRGYWLVKPSGQKTAMWAYFYELLNDGESDPTYVAPESANESFGKDGIASIKLQAYPVNEGITLIDLSSYDGAFVPVEIGGRQAIATDPTNVNNPARAVNNFMYFDVDDRIIPDTVRELVIEVTYYDLGTSPFQLQYNSTLPDDPPAYLGLATPIEVERTNTKTWVTHEFYINDAHFTNKLQHGLADFRLADLGDQLIISEVTVRRVDSVDSEAAGLEPNV